jgi:Receptor family ligand binding region
MLSSEHLTDIVACMITEGLCFKLPYLILLLPYIIVYSYYPMITSLLLGYNPVTEAMAYVFSDPQNNLAQIAYASNISSVSHENIFPDFLRTYPSSSYEGYAIADTLRTLNYSRVVLIHTSGLYGTDGSNEFIAAAVSFKIDIVATVNLDPGETDFSPLLSYLTQYDARVFVLIMSNINQAGAMMQYATSIGLLSEKTLVFGSASLAGPALWKSTSIASNPLNVQQMMKGFFAMSNADNDWKVTPRGKDFIRKFRALPNTAGTAGPNGLIVCNQTTDDDGGYKLYQASLSGLPPHNCIGFNFSAFAPDG